MRPSNQSYPSLSDSWAGGSQDSSVISDGAETESSTKRGRKRGTIDVMPGALVTEIPVPAASSDRRSRRGLAIRLRTPRWFLKTVLYAAVPLGLLSNWFSNNLDPIYPASPGVRSAPSAASWRATTRPNAATFYAAAADAFGSVYAGSDYPGDIAEGKISVQRRYVQRAQETFALLRQGMRYLYFPNAESNDFYVYPSEDDAALLESGSPLHDYRSVREIGRLLAASASVKAHDGDFTGSLSDSLDAVRYGMDIGHEPELISGLIGVLTKNYGAIEALRHIDHLSAPEARAGIVRLRQILKDDNSYASMMTTERDYGYGRMRGIFREGEIPSISMKDDESHRNRIWERLSYDAFLFTHSKQDVVDEYGRFMNKTIARTRLPYQQAIRLPDIHVQRSNLLWATLLFEPDQNTDSITKTAFRQHTECVARLHALLGRLAVHAYRREHHGEIPASLTLLTVGPHSYLETVPSDPLSMTGADPLRYNPKNGDVYSVGDNGLDDHDTGDDEPVTNQL